MFAVQSVACATLPPPGANKKQHIKKSEVSLKTDPHMRLETDSYNELKNKKI